MNAAELVREIINSLPRDTVFTTQEIIDKARSIRPNISDDAAGQGVAASVHAGATLRIRRGTYMKQKIWVPERPRRPKTQMIDVTPAPVQMKPPPVSPGEALDITPETMPKVRAKLSAWPIDKIATLALVTVDVLVTKAKHGETAASLTTQELFDELERRTKPQG